VYPVCEFVGGPLVAKGPTVFDLLANVMSAPLLVPMDINIDPNTNGLPGINQLRTIVGAVMTIGLILSVLALIVSAIVWGFGANSSNPHLASRGKIGVLVSCGAAVICGASVTLINFFWNVGQSV
jgi:putative tonB-box containing protein